MRGREVVAGFARLVEQDPSQVLLSRTYRPGLAADLRSVADRYERHAADFTELGRTASALDANNKAIAARNAAKAIDAGNWIDTASSTMHADTVEMLRVAGT